MQQFIDMYILRLVFGQVFCSWLVLFSFSFQLAFFSVFKMFFI